MLSGYRRTVIVQPGGLIRVEAPNIAAGTTVEVIVLIDSPTPAASPTVPDAPLPEREQFQYLRNQIIEAGIPLLSDIEIEQEVAERRGGYHGML